MPSIPLLVSDCLWVKATSFCTAPFGFVIMCKEVGLIVRKKGMGGHSDTSFLCLWPALRQILKRFEGKNVWLKSHLWPWSSYLTSVKPAKWGQLLLFSYVVRLSGIEPSIWVTTEWSSVIWVGRYHQLLSYYLAVLGLHRGLGFSLVAASGGPSVCGCMDL